MKSPRAGVAGIVDEHPVLARIDHDRGVDAGIVGRGKRQQRAGGVAEGEQPGGPGDFARLGPLGQLAREGRADHGHAGTGLAQGADLALGDGAAAGDDHAPAGQREGNGIHLVRSFPN